MALRLRDELESRGYQVVMIRQSHDVDISNAERAKIANDSGAEIFLRIHANGSDDAGVRGALTMAPTAANPYVGDIAAPCKRLSQRVVDAYCQATGFKNLGVQYSDSMSGINWCEIPVTILEMGFMTNQGDDEACLLYTSQLAMYLVENAHEPIIDRETFDRVQEMKGNIKQAVHIELML